MEVSGQLHAMATLLPGKELTIPLGKGAMWNTDPISMCWQRIKSLLLPGTEAWLSSP